MFFNELKPRGEAYRVVEILPEHYAQLCKAIRQELQIICFGGYITTLDPKRSTYKKACRRVFSMLDCNDENRKIGIIGELLMHLVVPKVFGSEIESVSRLLSLQDKNIKHGFDLNYFDNDSKMIWYGETKSGGTGIKRNNLILRAKNGLKKYLLNVDNGKEDDTDAVWDALVIESMAIFGSGSSKYQVFTECLFADRDSAAKSQSKNALLMVVNFGESENKLEEIQDIQDQLMKIEESHVFNKCLIISAKKDLYDDIFSFIEGEAKS